MFGDQEVKKIFIADSKFLSMMTESHLVLSEFDPIPRRIVVVAQEGAIGDWSAYFQTPKTGVLPGQVVAYGVKFPEEEARAIFPEWDHLAYQH